MHAQAHYPRKWMPIWHYVRQLSVPIDDIVEDLRRMSASAPSSRDAVVQRLRGTLKAAKLYSGSPARILASLRLGKITAPQKVEEFGAFASAVQGLPNDFRAAGELRPILLDCLKRDTASKHRHAIYRATSRIDEILDHQRKAELKKVEGV